MNYSAHSGSVLTVVTLVLFLSGAVTICSDFQSVHMLVKRNVPYWKDSEVLMAAVSLSAPPPSLHSLLITLKAL